MKPVIAMYLTPVLGFVGLLLLAMVSELIWPMHGSDDGRGIGSVIYGVFLGIAAVGIDLLIGFVLCFKSSQPGPNKYGPNPNEVPT